MLQRPQRPVPNGTNVFGGVAPVGLHPGVSGRCGARIALPTIHEIDDSDKLLSSIVYNVDRLANPGTQTKPWAIDGINRNGEIWVFMARIFNNSHVSLRPGVAGKKPAIGPKSLGDRLRPLYGNLAIPRGCANRFRIGSAALTWGGWPVGPDYVPIEQEFASWAAEHFYFTV